MFNAESDGFPGGLGTTSSSSAAKRLSGFANNIRNNLNQDYRSINNISGLDTVACLEGTKDVTVTGTTVRTSYNNCREEAGAPIFNGSTLVQLDSIDPPPTYIKITFINFHMLVTDPSDPAFEEDIHFAGSVTLWLESDIIALNVTFQDYTENPAGDTIYLKNFKITNIENLDGSFTESISGRIYHSVHGYIDIETIIDFSYAASGELLAGEMHITGADGRVKIEYTPTGKVLVTVTDLSDPPMIICQSIPLSWYSLDSPTWICTPPPAAP